MWKSTQKCVFNEVECAMKSDTHCISARQWCPELCLLVGINIDMDTLGSVRKAWGWFGKGKHSWNEVQHHWLLLMHYGPAIRPSDEVWALVWSTCMIIESYFKHPHPGVPIIHRLIVDWSLAFRLLWILSSLYQLDLSVFLDCGWIRPWLHTHYL